ncbi:RidA family protein [Chitinophaga sedimenti]|uniref:RidA family protein n=1 Tax=Chitinophaga sedimenti TaxID=2033606 RepID=UPI002003C49B|nr:RidA family protein [Chitinophaga sedimenti]MCK7558857.1 RidA family protein [Chitinophaga sedimenti]
MEKQIIKTDKAPAPIGPYNQAVKAGNTLYISGQVAIDPATNEVKKGDVTEETHLVMKNLQAILTEAGYSFGDVVKSTIFIMDMNDFGKINEVYGSYLDGNYPARETVQVAGLPKGVNVEIAMIAVK